MNIVAILFTIAMAGHSSADQYVQPVNLDTFEVRSTSTINFVDNNNNKFVRVGSEPVTYEELRFYALHECKNNKDPDEKTIDMLIRVEKQFSPPPAMRGMILAAACKESGYNALAKGDRKFSKNKRTAMAIGILQLWPIYEKMYPGLDRTNAEQSAHAWMQHIIKKIPKVKRQCKYRTSARTWLAAWVTGIRYKKVGGRCKEKPTHYRLLKKWHRNIKEDRKSQSYCTSEDVCGC